MESGRNRIRELEPLARDWRAGKSCKALSCCPLVSPSSTERKQSWLGPAGEAEEAEEVGKPGSPARQTAAGLSKYFLSRHCKESPRRKGSYWGARKAGLKLLLAPADLGRAVCSPILWLSGNPIASDIMGENQPWLSKVRAAPPSAAWPAGPSQNGFSFVSCLL